MRLGKGGIFGLNLRNFSKIMLFFLVLALLFITIGMIWGLDFSKFEGDMTKPLIAECFKNGLILERVGRDNNVLKLMPPVVIPDDLLLEGLQILKKSLAAIL